MDDQLLKFETYVSNSGFEASFELLTLIFKVVTTTRILESGVGTPFFNNQQIDMVFVSRFRRLSKKCCSISEYWLDTISNRLFVKFINVRKFRNLRHLTCINEITDEDLKYLPRLVTLNARGFCNITDAGIKGLSLHTLDASYNLNISDEGIRGLPLHTLNARGNENITNEGIKELPLHTLDASFNERITDEGINNLTLLYTLYAYWGSKITREGISHLPACKLYQN